jgi:RNA polymerase sigma-70 factor (ECF subfamily)
LVRLHRAAAFRVARQIVRNADDAEDVVQIASLKAYRAFDRFRVGMPFGPWFLTIVANEARSCWRARVRNTVLARRAAEEVALWDAPQLVSIDEFRAPLAAAIGSLPTKHREVVVCRYLLGLSEEETAQRLSLPNGTVKSRLSRAIERLRVELDVRGSSEEIAAA